MLDKALDIMLQQQRRGDHPDRSILDKKYNNINTNSSFLMSLTAIKIYSLGFLKWGCMSFLSIVSELNTVDGCQLWCQLKGTLCLKYFLRFTLPSDNPFSWKLTQL